MADLLGSDPFSDLAIATNKKEKKVKSGGFQSMDLNQNLFKAIMNKGYKLPTPIQRKCFGPIMAGRDVVAMARTGSGKTAAFLIPIINTLVNHQTAIGARALILSPTRELAQQTLMFCHQFGKYTDLRTCLIVGGSSLEDQFSKLAANPDLIIATPGRLRHLLEEVENFSLKALQFVVFDEGDRLFEMGFKDEINLILGKTADNHQTLVFSATLPEILAQFTRSGIRDPVIVRLDTEQILSPLLELNYYYVRDSDRFASLLYLLKDFIPSGKKIIVFASTKHHVEFLHHTISKLFSHPIGVPIYGTMDIAARKINLGKFSSGVAQILFVTDLAARGIDLPLLDVVINYDFPEEPKLFVHRVGRVARAGKSGVSYSLVSQLELPYLFDLALFLGQNFPKAVDDQVVPEYKPSDVRIGGIPRSLFEEYHDQINTLVDLDDDSRRLKKCMTNGLKIYAKTKKQASQSSGNRAKEYECETFIHPHFANSMTINEEKSIIAFENLRNFRPKETIFEAKMLRKGPGRTELMEMMEKQRMNNSMAITNNKIKNEAKKQKELEEKEKRKLKRKGKVDNDDENDKDSDEEDDSSDDSENDEASDSGDEEGDEEEDESNEYDDEEDYNSNINKASRNSNMFVTKKKFVLKPAVEKKDYKDSNFFLHHTKSNGNENFEKGLEIQQDRGATLEELVMNITPDDAAGIFRKRKVTTWNEKTKKYQEEQGGVSLKTRTVNESGIVVKKKAVKGKLYEGWASKSKQEIGKIGEYEKSSSKNMYEGHNAADKFKHHGSKELKNQMIKSELRTPEQVAKIHRERELNKTRHQPGGPKKQSSEDREKFLKKRTNKGGAPKKVETIKKRKDREFNARIGKGNSKLHAQKQKGNKSNKKRKTKH